MRAFPLFHWFSSVVLLIRDGFRFFLCVWVATGAVAIELMVGTTWAADRHFITRLPEGPSRGIDSCIGVFARVSVSKHGQHVTFFI